MKTDDDLLDFSLAAKLIQSRLTASLGAAEAKLREFCATGVVRSWKSPYSMVGFEPQGEGPQEMIEPSEWRHREIDLMTDKDGCHYFVDVSVSDLNYQLPVENPENSTFLDAAILKLLKAGRLPGKKSDDQWKPFCDDARKMCGKKPTDRGFSDETITKATRKIMRSFRST
jgi:hypothetical protein